MTELSEVVEFLSQTPTRLKILRLVETDQGVDQNTIEASLNVTNRTVKRTMKALTERGYLAEQSKTYHLTAFGASTLNLIDTVDSELMLAQQFSPFLSNIAADWFDVELHALADAELLLATEQGSFELVEKTLSIRRKTNQLRHISPIIEQKSVEQLAYRLQTGEQVTGEIIIPEQALQSWRNNPHYGHTYETVCEAEELSLYVSREPIPFMLCITESAVTAGVAKNGNPFAQIISQHPEIERWAHTTFESIKHRAAAEP